MKTRTLAVLFLLLIAAMVTWKIFRSESGADAVSQAAAGDGRGKNPAPGSDGGESDLPGAKPTAPSSRDDAPQAGEPRPNDPAVTRSSRRNTVVSPDGVRRTVIDPMASWENTPPWPEGPKLYAQVETSTRRYVNLRPDDVGDMPRVYAEAEERIELSVSFPDGEPGEKIFLELPNGGSFPDSDQFGRVLELPANRTLTFPYVTDESRGHCNVMIRHRGHSRSLPIWVGESPEPGS